MLLLGLLCVILGVIITLTIEVVYIYWYFVKQPEQPLSAEPIQTSTQLPESLLKFIQGEKWKDHRETCISLNLIFQFLFSEWKDTVSLRRWFVKKLSLEFLELQRTTTGRFLEQVTIRDLQLGNNVPVIKHIAVKNVGLHNQKKTLEELDLELDVDYAGGFQLAVDADMVLGRSAFLSVRVKKLKGKARLQLTRYPYTHWSFSFFEEPAVDFSVESQFQGRPLHHVTTFITNQIRRTLRKKHTLPNYKMRFKPFFPPPESPLASNKLPEADAGALLEGWLDVTIVECSRLLKVDDNSHLYCTVAIDSTAWIELVRSHGGSWITHDLEVNRQKGQPFGLTFRQEYVVDKYDNCVCVEAVIPNSPAGIAGIRKSDVMVTIGGTKVTSTKQAVKLFKHSNERFVVRVERRHTPKHHQAQETINQQVVLEEELVQQQNKDVGESVDGNLAEFGDDYVKVTIKDSGIDARSTSVSLQTATQESPKKTRTQTSPAAIQSEGSPQKDAAELKRSLRRGSTEQEGDSPRKYSLAGDDESRRSSSSDKEPTSVPFITLSSPDGGDSVDLRKTSLVKSGQEPAWKEKFAFPLLKHHRFLNIGVWCCKASTQQQQHSQPLPQTKQPEKCKKDTLLGYISIPVIPILEECDTNTRGYHIQAFKLLPPDATLQREFQKLSTHSGFMPHLCYGDILLTFLFRNQISGSPKTSRKTYASPKKVQDMGEDKGKFLKDAAKSVEPEAPLQHKRFEEIFAGESAPDSEDEYLLTEVTLACDRVGSHDFISTHFHSATVCNFCRKKIWLKMAFQCRMCSMICHKKCVAKCQGQTTCPQDLTVNTTSVLLSQTSPPAKAPQDLPADGAKAKTEDDLTQGTPKRSRVSTSSGSGSMAEALTGSPGASLQETPFAWWDPSIFEGNDIGGVLEHLLALPHDDVILSLAKERGKELYVSLSLEERKAKLNAMISKLQKAIDAETECRAELVREEKEADSPTKKAKLAFLVAKSDERTQALAVLMLHYFSGLQHCLDHEEVVKASAELPAIVSENLPLVTLVVATDKSDSAANSDCVFCPEQKLDHSLSDDDTSGPECASISPKDCTLEPMATDENTWSLLDSMEELSFDVPTVSSYGNSSTTKEEIGQGDTHIVPQTKGVLPQKSELAPSSRPTHETTL